MFRLIEAHLATAGEPDLGDRTPSCFLHRRTLDALLAERRDLALQIVTHEIQFVPLTFFGWMNRNFRRRQRENQPSVASVYGRKSQDLAEKGAISCRILAVKDYMGAKDHQLLPFAATILP